MVSENRQKFNGFALKALQKPIAVPNTELGVDTGEDLRPQEMKIEYQKNKQFVVVTQPTKYEHVQLTGNAAPIDPSTLQKDYWFGDARGGM